MASACGTLWFTNQHSVYLFLRILDVPTYSRSLLTGLELAHAIFFTPVLYSRCSIDHPRRSPLIVSFETQAGVEAQEYVSRMRPQYRMTACKPDLSALVSKFQALT